jgi:hypothetical protein
MMQSHRAAVPRIDDPGVRDYFMLCLGAVAVLFLVLLRRNLGPWACLPVAVGLLGAWQRWRLAPFLVLTCLAVLIIWREPWGDVRWTYRSPRTFRVPDWILSMAVLGYFIGHYRLQSLTLSILPADPRRRDESVDEDATRAPRGSPRRNYFREPPSLTGAEIGWAILALPICALLAQAFWRLLPGEPAEPKLQARVWQGIVTGWCLALALFVAHGVLRYLGWRRQSPREARLTLDDSLWQETRREQRRISYWLTWARLRKGGRSS